MAASPKPVTWTVDEALAFVRRCPCIRGQPETPEQRVATYVITDLVIRDADRIARRLGVDLTDVRSIILERLYAFFVGDVPFVGTSEGFRNWMAVVVRRAAFKQAARSGSEHRRMEHAARQGLDWRSIGVDGEAIELSDAICEGSDWIACPTQPDATILSTKDTKHEWASKRLPETVTPERFRDCVKRLTPRSRAILEMIYDHRSGTTEHAEVAQAFDMTPGAVRTVASRSKKELQACLVRDDGGVVTP